MRRWMARRSWALCCVRERASYHIIRLTGPWCMGWQALTHKLWSKEYLVSTNQADLTDMSQHAMCGVTNELFKPGADPRKLVKLAEQLRYIASCRAEEGLVKEARVALKQACFALPRAPFF